MSNKINKVVVKGVSYDIEDKNAASKALHYNSLNAIPTAEEVNIGGKSVDGSNTLSMDIPGATAEKAGVMMATDKKKLNNLAVEGANVDLNTYYLDGVYFFYSKRLTNVPILNDSVVSARLTVLTAYDGSSPVITQVLNLNNLSGGEGNIYIRSSQNGTWKPWGKLQTNVEVGQISQTQMDDIINNGMYSGVCVDTLETFILVVINNYAIATATNQGLYISHLKYSVDTNGNISVATRHRDAYGIWTEWENIGGGSEVDDEAIAKITSKAVEADSLDFQTRTNEVALDYRTIEGVGGEITIPAATSESAGVMTAEDKVALDTATSRALRALFIAAGAEYNDTDSVIEKTAPWGTEETWVKNDDGTYTYTETPAIVQHLPKHYYLNGLGDITEEQMMKIYNAPHYAMYEDAYAMLDIRTTLHKRSSGYAGGNFNGLCALSNIETFGIANSIIYTTSISSIFVGCYNLKHCNVILSPDNGLANGIVSYCGELITFRMRNLKGNINLSFSPKISKASILYIIQSATPTSAITINLHADAYARIANQPDILEALEAQPLVTLVSA